MLPFSFVAWKILTGVMILFMYLAPIAALVVPVLPCSGIKIRGLRFTCYAIIAAAFVPCYLGYLGWIHAPLPVNSTSSGLRSRFVQSWEEYQRSDALKEARLSITRTDLGVEIWRYKLLSYNAPKHFYVTLQAEDGGIVGPIYVSKHCNRHTDLRIGESYNTEVIRYSLSDSPDQMRYQFKNLYNTFCT